MGGVTYISRVLGCSRDTIRVGLHQLQHLSSSDLSTDSIRRVGGGRKRKLKSEVGIEIAFNHVIQKQNPKSSNNIQLSQHRILDLLEDQGISTNMQMVKRLMQKYEKEL